MWFDQHGKSRDKVHRNCIISKFVCEHSNVKTEMYIQMNTVLFVAGGSSHALLWLYKESVFRGLRCGDAWHGGVKLPVKPTETGKGHRQQHTWRVSLCFLTVSVWLSVWLCVCVGQRWVGGYECVSIPLYFWKPHGMKQQVHLHTRHSAHGGLSVSVSILLFSPATIIHTCTHTLNIQTHNFLQPHTHAPMYSSDFEHHIWYRF